MTVALGFVANDGIVLGADMQQTIGDIKTYDGKIGLYIFSHGGVIAAVGAGDVDYIQTAISWVAKDFPSFVTPERVESELRKRCLRFFDEHLSRWAFFPGGERPTVELLIAISGKKVPPALFHFWGTAFVRVYAKAIGSGVLLANDLISRYCRHRTYTVDQLSSLAIHILSKVKDGVVGCGGPTHLVGLRKGGDFALVDMAEVKQLEKKFSEAENRSDKDFAETLVRNCPNLSWHSEHAAKRTAKKVGAPSSVQSQPYVQSPSDDQGKVP